MKNTHARSRAVWLGLLVIVVVALLPRLVHPVSRPLEWYLRSVRFWNALEKGDLRGTYQRYHPGVSTMWIAGFGLRVYAWTHGWSGEDLLDPPQATGDYRPYPVEAGVAALAVAIALCIGLSYLLLVRLVDWRLGGVGGLLLALDPFYIAGSKVLHVDALLATLMFVSALFLLLYLREDDRRFLVLGGVFAGLSFLTKGPSLFLIPYAVLIVGYSHLIDDGGSGFASGKPGLVTRLGEIARELLIWGGTAGGVFVLLWPAMWVMPGEALSTMGRRVLFHVETAHRNPNFFAGRAVVTDPGPLFYLATIGWKTTVLTLPGLLGAVIVLARRIRTWKEARWAWCLLVFGVGFAVAMSFAARKEMRYLQPVFPIVDVLAAWGLIQIVDGLTARAGRGENRHVGAVAVASVLIAQFALVVSHHPYYGTHHNLLLGGSRVAQRVLPMGDQGEGQHEAARFLASFPRAEERMIGVHRRYEELFERIYPGRSEGLEDPYIDYYVFGINSIQRQNRLDLWDDAWAVCQDKEPLWTAAFDGVIYAWIYGGFESDPAAFSIDHPLDVQLGDHIHLVGYTLSSPEHSTDPPLVVTLFWQSDGRARRDHHVFVHLLNQEGAMVAQHDGVPADGQRPTWDWRYREMVEDEHPIVVGELQQGETFSLYVGMYDYETKNRLPARGPDGQALPHNRIHLQDVQVGRHVRPESEH
jgi:hypothetical protein